ncbi:MAG TPA: carboxypeptidase regulatory-like domain-containing protein [Candidatus Binatia bacterium]|nr:carboxypeptidase regulatory-like domain-containing protein [Candidatus Binatia bacterium]
MFCIPQWNGGAWGQKDSSAVLRGRVTSVTGRPISQAEVILRTAGRRAVTDDSGRFAITALPEGEQLILVRRIGFRPLELIAIFKPGKALESAIVLELAPHSLPDVEVVGRPAKPIEYAWTMKYDGFFERRRKGFGHFLTREQIEKRRPWRTPNLLAGIAGITLRFVGPGIGMTEVEFSRCRKIGVWIDGTAQRPPDSGLDNLLVIGEMLDLIRPSQIEAMEVYSGPAELPAEYSSGVCAAIVIWTR